MKKSLLIIILAIAFSSCTNNNNLVGEWTSQDKYGVKETTIFKEDGSFIAIRDNKMVDFNFKDKSFKYDVDESHSPHWLDVIVYDDENKEEIMRLKGIYEFLSKSTIRVYFSSEKADPTKILIRPKEFDKNDTEILTKKPD